MAAHGNVYTVLRGGERCQGPRGAACDTGTETGKHCACRELAREPQSEHARTSTQMERAGTGEVAHSGGRSHLTGKLQSYFTQELK